MLLFTFLRRDMLLYLCPFSYYASAANGSSDLYTYWRSYINLNTLSMVFLILFAPNTTMSLVVMPVNTDSCECFVFLQEGYIVMHDIKTIHN